MDTCVMCGKYAGEGRQVCLQCEYKILKKCDRCMYQNTNSCLICSNWRCVNYDTSRTKRKSLK